MTTLRPPEGPWGGVIPEGWEEHTGERISGLWYAVREHRGDVWDKAYKDRSGLNRVLIYIKPKEKKVEKDGVHRVDVERIMEGLRPKFLVQTDAGESYKDSLEVAKEFAINQAKLGDRVTVYKAILKVIPGEPQVKEYEA